MVRERQQRDRTIEEVPTKSLSSPTTDSPPIIMAVVPQTDPLYKASTDIDQDLIILDSSHEESIAATNGIIVGLSKSPQLHARSLLKSPEANRSQSKEAVSCEVSGATSNVDVEENRLDTLIKILAKESTSVQMEEANQKERMEIVSHPKLNSLLINIPNNQTHKSSNQGSAKPLAPEQLKCNILKGKWFLF